MTSGIALRLSYRIDVHSAFHIGTGSGAAGLVDGTVLRAADRGLLIPGSTVKGRLRHHLEQIARTLGLACCGGTAADPALCKPESPQEAQHRLCLACRLFGSEWQPSTLYYSDATLPRSLRDLLLDPRSGRPADPFDAQVRHRPRIRMDRILRRAAEGALFSFEEGRPGLSFEGRIEGRVPCTNMDCDAPLPLELLALTAALRLLDSLGGKKTAGLGECRLGVTELQLGSNTISNAELSTVFDEHFRELTLYDDYRAQ
jgi:CRISPR/Cas system CSM-associated protein Csm3 (group 7 of RAMP superfamily)